jgi:hypothetical protein
MSVLNSKIKGCMLRRLERRPEELTLAGERIKARKNELSRLLAQRNTSGTNPRKGPNHA